MALTPEERHALLQLARETITRTAHRQKLLALDLSALPHRLRDEGASFVTLTTRGELRGCIGSLEAHRPLAVDVRENAIAAAFHDPRFPPVNAGELECAAHRDIRAHRAPTAQVFWRG